MLSGKSAPEKLRTIIVLEEAHKLFLNKSGRYDLGEPMIFGSARTFRKRKIGFFYSDQAPSELPSALSGNLGMKYLMRTVNGKCISRMQQVMNLRREQAEILPILEKFHYIFQSGDYPEPVLVKVPDLFFDYVSDEEVASHMEEILPTLEYVPVVETTELSENEESGIPGAKVKSGARPNKLWTEIAKILAEIRYISLSSLYANLGNVSPWFARKIVNEMEKQDMIELCPISLGTRGNPKTFVVLKPKGAEFIGVDYDDIRLQGKGSTEHVILQNLIAEAMKDSGKTVTVEHHINGKSVDIAEIREDGSIAYEVELSPAHRHVVENILRDLNAGFDEVAVITRNQTAQNEAKDRIYKNIPWEKISKVKFKLLREFL